MHMTYMYSGVWFGFFVTYLHLHTLYSEMIYGYAYDD